MSRPPHAVRSPRPLRKALAIAATGLLPVSAGLVVVVPSTAAPAVVTAQVWVTTADGKHLLDPGPSLSFGGKRASLDITVDTAQRGQVFTGVGASMTESSASLISGLSSSASSALLNDLFGPRGAGLSLLRQPLGASDFVSHLPFYSYQDTPGILDLHRDSTSVLPLVKQAKAVNPKLQVMGTPWSAPAWMKDSGSLTGGALRDSRVRDYAAYLASVVRAYAAAGVPLAGITPVNEPGNSTHAYPSMSMSTTQQVKVIRALDAALANVGLRTPIWVDDHNWDSARAALQMLRSLADVPRVAGAALHCYAGSPQDMRTVADAGWPVRETECSGTDSTVASRTFSDTLMWQGANLAIEGLRSGSQTVMLWNLALDSKGGPSFGACGTRCNGVVQISGSTVTRNADYYVLAHVGRFVRPGAVRVASSSQGLGGLQDVVFVNPDGSRAAVMINPTGGARPVSITEHGTSADYTIPARSLVTVTWPKAP